MIQQAAGTRHDDFHAVAQGLHLLCHAHATVDGHAAQPGLPAESKKRLVNLLRQLTGRRDDQRTRPSTRSAFETL